MLQTYFSQYPENILQEMEQSEIKMAITGLQEGLDDVLNVSGHRIGTAEVESAMC